MVIELRIFKIIQDFYVSYNISPNFASYPSNILDGILGDQVLHLVVLSVRSSLNCNGSLVFFMAFTFLKKTNQLFYGVSLDSFLLPLLKYI